MKESLLIEKACQNKATLKALKKLALDLNLFELAADIREVEVCKFSPTKEESDAKLLAEKLNLLFRMVELNISEPTCWLIYEAINVYKDTGGEFSITHAQELLSKKDSIFS